MTKPKKPTNKEMANGIMNNYNNLNLLANYINDYIDYRKDVEEFKTYIVKKYERINKENGQANNSDTNGDRKDQPGDTPTNTKSPETGGEPKKRTDKAKAK